MNTQAGPGPDPQSQRIAQMRQYYGDSLSNETLPVFVDLKWLLAALEDKDRWIARLEADLAAVRAQLETYERQKEVEPFTLEHQLRNEQQWARLDRQAYEWMMKRQHLQIRQLEADLAAVRSQLSQMAGTCGEEAGRACAAEADLTAVRAQLEEAELTLKARVILPYQLSCMNCGTAAAVHNDRCQAHYSAAARLQTEVEMHNAWRKRATEAETALTALRAQLEEANKARLNWVALYNEVDQQRIAAEADALKWKTLFEAATLETL